MRGCGVLLEGALDLVPEDDDGCGGGDEDAQVLEEGDLEALALGGLGVEPVLDGAEGAHELGVGAGGGLLGRGAQSLEVHGFNDYYW